MAERKLRISENEIFYLFLISLNGLPEIVDIGIDSTWVAISDLRAVYEFLMKSAIDIVNYVKNKWNLYSKFGINDYLKDRLKIRLKQKITNRLVQLLGLARWCLSGKLNFSIIQLLHMQGGSINILRFNFLFFGWFGAFRNGKFQLREVDKPNCCFPKWWMASLFAIIYLRLRKSL